MKNGFTLIELLAVIVILSVILVIAIPSLNGVLNSSKDKVYDASVASIINASKDYVLGNPDDFKDGDHFTLSITDLCNSKYLNCPIYDPTTGDPMDGTVTIDRVNNSFNYTYNE